MATNNIINNDGKKIIINRTFKSVPDYTAVKYYKVGINSATPLITDTNLTNPIPIKNTEIIDDCEAITGWTDSADMTLSVNSTHKKVGNYSLNLTKDGTGSASASTSKTTTSYDFTSKALSIWIYITDTATLNKLATSNCLEIRYGSDASNYYKWTKNKADLSVGWNLFMNLTSSNATVVSSPTITACDYTFIQLTATASSDTWAADSIAMDDIKLISTDDYLDDIDSTSPELDEINKEVTITTYLSSLEATGYDIDSLGLFNDDGTPLMFGEITFDSESKNQTDEFSFTVVYRQL